MPRPRPIPVLVLAGLLLSSGGCQRFRERIQARREARQQAREAREAAKRAEEAALVRSSTIIPETDPGLEVVVWTSDDAQFAVGRLLAEFLGNPVPMPEEDRAAWRALGIRVVAVPLDRVDALVAAARPVTPVQRQRFGLLADWTPVVRGPALPETVPGPRGEPLRADGGRGRIIARSWLEPDLSGGSVAEVVRAELALQIESRQRPIPEIDRLVVRASVAEAGPVIEGSPTSLAADGRTAIVLVAEDPSVDYAALPAVTLPPEPSPDAAAAGPSASPPQGPLAQPAPIAPAPFPSTPSSIGPAIPRERTLGERMLSSPGAAPSGGRPAQGPRKVVVLLIPRTGGPAPEAAGASQPLAPSAAAPR